MPRLSIEPQGQVGRWVDRKLDGFMRWYSGFPEEEPQKTHRWNNHHLGEEGIAHLDPSLMVSHEGTGKRTIPYAGALSHFTRVVRGWRTYLVLAPADWDGEWYVGWRWRGGGGVSRIPHRGPLRVTVGPGATEWFGVRALDGEQIRIEILRFGTIGNGGEDSKLALF